jgi:DNA-binding ferritin-like protein
MPKVTTGEGFSLPELVNNVQGFCLGLRLTHWETTGLALHKATEATQESLEGSLDAFVEACVGCNEGKRPTFNGTVSKETDPDKLIEYLKNAGVKDTSLLNIRDEMLQALYKFKYLKTLS